ncbi:kinase-like domain-containing protein [Lyophyllum atratum]|nr:kinase-like domain-containing protein [Lyophyllum atratum]
MLRPACCLSAYTNGFTLDATLPTLQQNCAKDQDPYLPNSTTRHQHLSTVLAAPASRVEEDQLSTRGWSASDVGERYSSVADLRAHIGLGQLPIQVVKLIARDVLRGLENLHEARGIAHGVLCLNNIMLSPRDMRALVSQLSAEQPSLLRSEASFETMFLDVNSMLTSTSQPVFTLSSVEAGDSDRDTMEDGQGLRSVMEGRALRAPEIIMGAPYESSADIWILGCLIYELLTGESLFDPQFQTLDLGLTSEESHLIQMIEIFGPFHPEMLDACPKADQWFTDTCTLRIETTYYPVTLETILQARIEADDVASTAAFLEMVLQLDPKERFKARDLINHPWFMSC